jgi:hypothetical protein
VLCRNVFFYLLYMYLIYQWMVPHTGAILLLQEAASPSTLHQCSVPVPHPAPPFLPSLPPLPHTPPAPPSILQQCSVLSALVTPASHPTSTSLHLAAMFCAFRPCHPCLTPYQHLPPSCSNVLCFPPLSPLPHTPPASPSTLQQCSVPAPLPPLPHTPPASPSTLQQCSIPFSHPALLPPALPTPACLPTSISLHLKTQLIQLLYVKSLAISCAARSSLGVGAILNLQSNDASKIWGLPTYGHVLWNGPFQVGRGRGCVYKGRGGGRKGRGGRHQLRQGHRGA